MATAKKTEEKKEVKQSTAKQTTAKKEPAKKEPAKKEVVKAAPKAAPKEEPEKKEDKKKVYHVAKRKEDGKWQVKFAGGEKAIKLFDTQAEAIEYANKLAENQDGSMQIHKVDGKIRKQDYSKK